MSKSSPPKDWDKLWLEYNKSLKAWMSAFESLQNATKDVQTKYNDVMAKALKESSDKTMNQFTENWQKSMNKAGIDTFKQFGDNWQKVFNQSGMDQVKTYGDMMNKFAETWQKMWSK
jgi:predicted patatin/cPLA2 family phospholipase